MVRWKWEKTDIKDNFLCTHRTVEWTSMRAYTETKISETENRDIVFRREQAGGTQSNWSTDPPVRYKTRLTVHASLPLALYTPFSNPTPQHPTAPFVLSSVRLHYLSYVGIMFPFAPCIMVLSPFRILQHSPNSSSIPSVPLCPLQVVHGHLNQLQLWLKLTVYGKFDILLY